MITEQSPFVITQYDKFVTVTWPTFENIKEVDTKNKLADIMFKESKAYEVGFVVLLNNKEYDILWVNVELHYLKVEYVEYLLDMYTIKGVAFRSKPEAELIKEWLEKKYIWQLLKG